MILKINIISILAKFSLVLVFFFVACTAKRQEPLPIKVYPIPWVTWEEGHSISGTLLGDRFISRGDELFFAGKYFEALEQYYATQTKRPSITDFNESLQLRIVSCLLLLDEASKALDALSTFYKLNAKPVNTVRSEAALMFAYIYGRQTNIHQSLAWFSQSLKDAQHPQLKAIIEKGVLLLLSRLPKKDLQEVEQRWQRDYFLKGLIRIEQKRRLQPGIEIISIYEFPRFWEEDISVTKKKVDLSIPNRNGIMVLLPLSGRYARFGQNVKQGIELALGGNDQGLDLVFRDTQASPAQAAAVCNELAATRNYSVIIGPLLYTTSETVAECAKRYGLKMFSFTKKSDFQEGKGVYRLGVDAESQVNSLVTTLTQLLGFRRYAIAYPADSESKEFVAEFKKAVSDAGANLVSEYVYYQKPTPDFRELSREVDITQPQALFLLDSLHAANRVSVALGDRRMKTTRLIGPAEWSDLAMLMQSANSLNGLIFSSAFYENAGPLAQRFASTYQEVYQTAPDFLAAQGFDAATLVKVIIAQLKAGQNWEQIVANFKVYNGLTGQISFFGPQKLKRRLKVVEFIDSNLKELTSESAPSFVYRGNNEQ